MTCVYGHSNKCGRFLAGGFLWLGFLVWGGRVCALEWRGEGRCSGGEGSGGVFCMTSQGEMDLSYAVESYFHSDLSLPVVESYFLFLAPLISQKGSFCSFFFVPSSPERRIAFRFWVTPFDSSGITPNGVSR